MCGCVNCIVWLFLRRILKRSMYRFPAESDCCTCSHLISNCTCLLLSNRRFCNACHASKRLLRWKPSVRKQVKLSSRLPRQRPVNSTGKSCENWFVVRLHRWIVLRASASSNHCFSISLCHVSLERGACTATTSAQGRAATGRSCFVLFCLWTGCRQSPHSHTM